MESSPRQEPTEEVDHLARDLIGAAIEVHGQLGPGYLESVYGEALAVEMGLRGIAFERQRPVAVSYKGRAIGEARLDFLVGGVLVAELKAVEEILPIHQAQVISYLKATGLTLGLLINSNVPLLKKGISRLVLSPCRPPDSS